jgi:hypothetical protein
LAGSGKAVTVSHGVPRLGPVWSGGQGVERLG